MGGQEQRVILLPATIASEHHGQKKPLPPAFTLSALPFLPSSSFAKDALSQSKPCVLQCPHCALGILRPAAQIRGVGAKKRACDKLCPSLRGKEQGEERTKQPWPRLLPHSCLGPHMRYTPGLLSYPLPPAPTSTHVPPPQYSLVTETSEEHKLRQK